MAEPVRSVKSVCPYCGVGCGIVMEVAGNRVIKVSGDRDHPANFGRLCTKGSTCAQALSESGRMEFAYARAQRQQPKAQVAMDQAITLTAQRLRRLLDEHGPDALSFYVSGQMSLESQYLVNKLAKGFIGTNNIESNSRLCMASAATGYKQSLGADGPPGSYEDFDHAEVFFVIGANMADCHPILFLRLLDRLKAGARLIVVDPRRNGTADKADLFLQIKPGTDLALLNGLLHLLVVNGHTDADFIARFTEGWEVMPAFLQDYPPAVVARITGLAEAHIRQAALWIGQARAWMSCWTMGLNQSTHGTWNTNALCNLSLATGAICKPGSGPFSLTGQPNAMGGREMGYMGPGLPGQRSVLVEEDCAFIEKLWQVPAGTLHARIGGGSKIGSERPAGQRKSFVNDNGGERIVQGGDCSPNNGGRGSGGTVAMFEDLAAGKIKACWIICTNPVATVPDRKKVIAALQAAELVICQDAFLDNETNPYADILLPGALWAEAEGVMINSERNLTLMQQAVQPAGETLPDWQIIARVACEMGYAQAFTYASASDVFDEIRQASNPATGYDLRGASHARLREGPLQWPVAAGTARNPIRYLNDGVSQALLRTTHGAAPALVFATESGRARFLPRPHMMPAEMPDEDFPFVLNTGRLQHHWHTMTKTGKIATLNKLSPGPFVEIHPEDASALGIESQKARPARVEVRSRRGHVILPAVLSERVRPGNCFVPFHWNDVFGEQLAINALTNDAVDASSLQPEFKFCAVSLARVAAMAIAEPDADQEQPASCEAAALLLLHASSTGNAQTVAAECAAVLRGAGHELRLASMEDVEAGDLALANTVLFFASTFGDGDAPESGAALWAALQQVHAPALALRETQFAVLAFGDSNYDQFCGFGCKLDARLEMLGAKRLLERVDCEPDFQPSVLRWLQTLVAALPAPANGTGLTAASHASLQDHSAIGSDRAAFASPSRFLSKVSDVSSGPPLFTRHTPLQARLISNRLLNAPGASKETRQYVFDLGDSGFSYEAGDALGVWPVNCPALVGEIIATLGLDAASGVEIAGLGHMPLGQALQKHSELTRVNAELLRLLQSRSGDAMLAGLLDEDRRADLGKWLWGRQVADVLKLFPIACDAQTLVSSLKRLQPRFYSISSSPLAHPDQVHLTVSTVRYAQQDGLRAGLCSGYLADRCASASVAIFVQRSASFRLPKDLALPIIMVGPGTGVAPFRAFLQQRKASGASGRNWLLFGEQRAASDFYYRDEFLALQNEGVLNRLDTAFSRDQPEKIYVQHRLLEHGETVWSWLEQGAHFYVCGDGNDMAKDVDAALKQVVQKHGRFSEAGAALYVSTMAKERRYLRDVY
ncbi:MAG: molybdopterin-dependent oxidoreductase [Janthinobacterium lividum]